MLTMSEPATDLMRLLRRVHQVREYQPESFARGVLTEILDVGRWSGSANNRQTTEVVVVEDPQARQKIAEGGAAMASKAGTVLVLVTQGDPAREALEIFDEGRMAERLLIAAQARGLGSAIATLKGEGPAAIKQLLGIPAERRVVTAVSLGVPDVAAIRAKPKNQQPRKPLDQYAHWGRY
jgi:nitroreductase